MEPSITTDVRILSAYFKNYRSAKKAIVRRRWLALLTCALAQWNTLPYEAIVDGRRLLVLSTLDAERMPMTAKYHADVVFQCGPNGSKIVIKNRRG